MARTAGSARTPNAGVDIIATLIAAGRSGGPAAADHEPLVSAM
ncbi:hypothetical protein [Planobispora longispora]|nr:hypothetical protein [Planobispora longispora]